MYTQRLRVDDLQSEQEDFAGATAYARSKRAEVVLTEMWEERLVGIGVTAHSMHPGLKPSSAPRVGGSRPQLSRPPAA